MQAHSALIVEPSHAVWVDKPRKGKE